MNRRFPAMHRFGRKLVVSLPTALAMKSVLIGLRMAFRVKPRLARA